MKIVFFNVWGGTTGDALRQYVQEQATDTDIFCFQESTEEVHVLLADLLADYQKYSDSKLIGLHDGFELTIYAKKGIAIESVETLFKDDLTVGLAQVMRLRTGKGLLSICNAHGRSVPVEKNDSPERIRYSESLLEYFADKEGQVIIGGDFNLNPNTRSVQVFSEQGYVDLVAQYNIDTTRNRLAWDRFPVKMLFSDYAFVNEAVHVTHFEVPKNEVSDHLPMLLEIAD